MADSQAIFVEIDGILRNVTKNQLFELAKEGKIQSETKLLANGKETTVGKVKGIVFKKEKTKEGTYQYRWVNNHWVPDDYIVTDNKEPEEISNDLKKVLNEVFGEKMNPREKHHWENDQHIINERVIENNNNNNNNNNNENKKNEFIGCVGCSMLLLLIIAGIIRFYYDITNSSGTAPLEAKQEAWFNIISGLVFVIICGIIFVMSFSAKNKGCITLAGFIFLISILSLFGCIRKGTEFLNMNEQEWQKVVEERQKEEEKKEIRKRDEEREREEDRERSRRYREQRKLEKELKKNPPTIIIIEK
jgi:hypothetical protein